MSFQSFDDATICALATPPGEGGIGIIRISGPLSLAISQNLFRPHKPVETLKSHRIYYGSIVDPVTHEAIDEALLSYMAAPRTYTREDVVEINCHSGYAALNCILELVLAQGARLASPGEFTRRAFLNGRIDLSQAEAVADVIRSKSATGLQMANRMLQGDLKKMVLEFRDLLLRFEAEMEAVMDFSDDIESDEDSSLNSAMAATLRSDILAPIKRIIDQYDSGRILKEGLTLVLVGRPNVGKSSLLNALLGKDRAIVSPIPGTTRDVIEAGFLLSGVQVRILDTAGIRSEPDSIESMGIERAMKSIEEADAILWLLDGSRAFSKEDLDVFKAIESGKFAVIVNKADLPAVISLKEIEALVDDRSPIFNMSVHKPSDIQSLRDYLEKTFIRAPLEGCRSMIIPNLRQKECFELAAQAIEKAVEHLHGGGFSELISFELRAARIQLELILGINSSDDLLDRIFSQFCIGK